MTTSIGGTTGITFNDASVQNTAATGFGFKNRIINGAMVIDQRNAGASVSITPSTGYAVDRFQSGIAQGSSSTAQQSTNAPAGFTSSLLVTVGTGASPAAGNVSRTFQAIEGFNTADLGFGLATASTITLSFWVKSSLTGTFAGGLYNNAANRTYVFTYAISAANTWEQKSVTITGDTSGTWLTNNGTGIVVNWDLGSGSTYQATAGVWAAGVAWATSGSVKLAATSGATWAITGVQLEKGSTATAFDYLDYGRSLIQCQRYYIKINNPSGYNANYGPLVGAYTSIRSLGVPYCLPVPMRVNGATFVIAFSNVSLYLINLSTSYAVTSIGSWSGDFSTPSIDIGVASGLTSGTSYIFTILANGFISYSAEL